jgi:hypothetical protein
MAATPFIASKRAIAWSAELLAGVDATVILRHYRFSRNTVVTIGLLRSGQSWV